MNSPHVVLAQAGIPQTLLRKRLALAAAEACVVRLGRPERAGDLHDVIHLPGPAGEIYLQWRRAAARPVLIKALRRAFSWSESSS